MNFKPDNPGPIQSLRFSVVEVSSEDSEYPADGLATQSNPPRGWQTQRSAFFPQYIVLRFPGPCLVHQFKLLSHQAKIASKIDVYISKPEEGCLTPNFQKLGYFPLSNNEGSAYQSREIKIVQIGLPISFVKLVLHQPHANSLNFFNQAGIVAVSFMGYHLLEKESPSTPLQSYTTVNLKQVIPREIQYQIQRLEALKAQAVADENFLLAKQLKEEIQKTKAKFTELLELEQEKKMAIEREDYDVAMQLKEKIEQVKLNLSIPIEPKTVGGPSTARNGSPSSRNGHMPNLSMISSNSYNPDYTNTPINYQTKGNMSPKDLNQFSRLNYQQRPNSRPRMIDGLPKQSQGLSTFLDEDLRTNQSGLVNRSFEVENGRAHSQRIQSRSPEIKKTTDINIDQFETKPNFAEQPSPKSISDERPLPTLVHKAETSFENQTDDKLEGEGEAGQETRISEKNLYKIDQLSHVFSNPFLIQSFSMQISNRIKSTEKLIECFQNTDESKDFTFSPEIFIGKDLSINLLGSFKLALNLYEERSPQLVNLSLQVLELILTYVYQHHLQSSFKSSAESELRITEFMVLTFEKMSDYRNTALLNSISKVFYMICHSQLESIESLISQITMSKSPKAKIENFKNRIGQLKIVKNLFTEFQKSDPKLSKSVLVFAAQMLDNANKDVRSEARDLVAKIAESMGDEQVIKSLEQLQVRKNNLDEVKKQFAKQKKVAQQKAFAEDKPIKTVPSQELTEVNMQPAHTMSPVNAKTQEPIIEPEILQKTCHFCKKSDPIFNDMDRFDFHLWKECPMLTSCRECLQIIEVADYNAHLLSECKNADVHCECPRCRQVINIDHIDQHVTSLECAPLDLALPIIRCPLCHSDLKVRNGDTEEAWRQHLVIQTCPNNERS